MGDGLPDLLFLTNGGPQSKSTNKLYRQKAAGDWNEVFSRVATDLQREFRR